MEREENGMVNPKGEETGEAPPTIFWSIDSLTSRRSARRTTPGRTPMMRPRPARNRRGRHCSPHSFSESN